MRGDTRGQEGTLTVPTQCSRVLGENGDWPPHPHQPRWEPRDTKPLTQGPSLSLAEGTSGDRCRRGNDEGFGFSLYVEIEVGRSLQIWGKLYFSEDMTLEPGEPFQSRTHWKILVLFGDFLEISDKDPGPTPDSTLDSGDSPDSRDLGEGSRYGRYGTHTEIKTRGPSRVGRRDDDSGDGLTLGSSWSLRPGRPLR